MRKSYCLIVGVFIFILLSYDANDKKNKEWQQRMEIEGQQMRRDVNHAIGKDDAMYHITEGEDN